MCSYIYGSNTIFVTGCTSQIVGIRLFKLAGPSFPLEALPMLKNSDPSISNGIGGS